MKQINLYPSELVEPEDFHVNPFWRRFAVFTVCALLIASAFAILLQRRVQDFEEQLQQAKKRLAALQPEVDRFNALVKERNEYRAAIEELERELNGSLSTRYMSHVGLAEMLRQVATVLPRGVWLRSMDCSVTEGLLVLDVSAESEAAMQELLAEGLHKRYGRDAVKVNTIQRVTISPSEIEYEVTVQLPLPRPAAGGETS